MLFSPRDFDGVWGPDIALLHSRRTQIQKHHVFFLNQNHRKWYIRSNFLTYFALCTDTAQKKNNSHKISGHARISHPDEHEVTPVLDFRIPGKSPPQAPVSLWVVRKDDADITLVFKQALYKFYAQFANYVEMSSRSSWGTLTILGAPPHTRCRDNPSQSASVLCAIQLHGRCFITSRTRK